MLFAKWQPSCVQFPGCALGSLWSKSRMQLQQPWLASLNTLGPQQNGHHFADKILKLNSINEKSINLIKIQLCSLGSNIQSVIIGAGNGLVPNRWQGLAWTNDDQEERCHTVPLGHSELTHWPLGNEAVTLNWWFSNSCQGYIEHFVWNCPQVNATGLHWWYVNIGSGNGLVPSGNKPLPEPMLIQIFVAILRH